MFCASELAGIKPMLPRPGRARNMPALTNSATGGIIFHRGTAPPSQFKVGTKPLCFLKLTDFIEVLECVDNMAWACLEGGMGGFCFI